VRLVTTWMAVFSGSGLGAMPTMIESPANNTLERTRGRRGRFVLAMDGVLAEAESRRWWAAQLGR